MQTELHLEPGGRRHFHRNLLKISDLRRHGEVESESFLCYNQTQSSGA